jgi:hypothetical protein
MGDDDAVFQKRNSTRQDPAHSGGFGIHPWPVYWISELLFHGKKFTYNISVRTKLEWPGMLLRVVGKNIDDECIFSHLLRCQNGT